VISGKRCNLVNEKKHCSGRKEKGLDSPPPLRTSKVLKAAKPFVPQKQRQKREVEERKFTYVKISPFHGNSYVLKESSWR
jgi:hypothetical protein